MKTNSYTKAHVQYYCFQDRVNFNAFNKFMGCLEGIAMV